MIPVKTSHFQMSFPLKKQVGRKINLEVILDRHEKNEAEKKKGLAQLKRSPNPVKLKQLSALESGSLLYRKQMSEVSRRKVMLQSTEKLIKSYKVAESLQLAYLPAETSLTSAGQNFSRKRKIEPYSHAQKLASYLSKCCCRNHAVITWSFAQTASKSNIAHVFQKRAKLAISLVTQSYVSEKKSLF